MNFHFTNDAENGSFFWWGSEMLGFAALISSHRSKHDGSKNEIFNKRANQILSICTITYILDFSSVFGVLRQLKQLGGSCALCQVRQCLKTLCETTTEPVFELNA